MSENEQLNLEWKERIELFRKSGKSMRQWCDENGFKVHQLQYWIKKFRNKNRAKKVTVDNEQPTTATPVTANVNDSKKKGGKIEIVINENNMIVDYNLLADIIRIITKK